METAAMWSRSPTTVSAAATNSVATWPWEIITPPILFIYGLIIANWATEANEPNLQNWGSWNQQRITETKNTVQAS